MDVLGELSKKYPIATSELESFLRLYTVMNNFKLDTFFEPKSYVSVEDEKPKFITELNADLVTSWVNHISGSTIVRMNSLENGILGELYNGRLLTCYVLARSHMESASVATYALERLNECVKTRKWDELRDIISQFFFGTSMKNEKNNESADEFLGLLPEATKRFPPSPAQAIKALNRYCEGFIEKPVRDFRMDYALLCDYVHHSQMGTRNFVTVHRETEDGWFLSYNRNDAPTQEQVKILLRIILPNMGIGYANALMLYYKCM